MLQKPVSNVVTNNLDTKKIIIKKYVSIQINRKTNRINAFKRLNTLKNNKNIK